MKILSIDIGIKNLALCLFEKADDSNHFCIKTWDSINVSQQDIYKCNFIEKNKVCNKLAKYTKNDVCYCLKHSKKQVYQIPTTELKSSFINKQKIQKLMEIASKYNIKHDKSAKKADLISLINEFIHTNCFEEVKSTNASKVDLVTIGINIKYKFDTLFTSEDQIDYVIIENQISPIANRMKTIQGMIAQYFIMSDVGVDHIEFISSANKLKDFGTNVLNNNNEGKMKYSDRKKMGIAKCLEIISGDHQYSDKLEYFNSHSKKDDLADSFLQGLWFINNKKL